MLTITYSVDGGGCEIRTHAPLTGKRFSRPPRYDHFDNPP